MLNNRRCEMEIISNILSLSTEGANKTKLLYQGNLSYTQLKNYLSFLIEKEFIHEIKLNGNNGNGYSKIYKITEKGVNCLKDIDKVLTYLK